MMIMLLLAATGFLGIVNAQTETDGSIGMNGSCEYDEPWQAACDAVPRDDSIGWFDELYIRLAFDGSKQPQDFGVNAVAGGQATMNLGLPLLRQAGIGIQAGTSITATSNAVRVYELVGETTGRTQSFTTLGLFQRLDSGWAWGVVHDFLHEDYYDDFNLGQWRIRSTYDLNDYNQIGVTAMLRSYDDIGTFGAATNVRLKSIDQLQFAWRHYWQSSAQTAIWVGLADEHSEDNAVTGFAPAKDESFLFGADVLMPLTPSLAIFGETNIITPIDTGTVDAYLGIQWYPGSRAYSARRGRYSPLFEVASPVSMAADLIRL
ncbi:DUF6666 family protein [Roseiconus lacunae]|uniref:Porin n=2 Tax=Roseiconus lacunae TaxID=2605694 RepID=A0ABT7PCV8_9BACT|nr:DUF6666 family protein [Roseiconus lacunae]MDM4014183.1 hypothetical protein [Roseiconus lacunae]